MYFTCTQKSYVAQLLEHITHCTWTYFMKTLIRKFIKRVGDNVFGQHCFNILETFAFIS